MKLTDSLIEDILYGIQALIPQQKRSMRFLQVQMERCGHNFSERQMFSLCHKLRERGYIDFAYRPINRGDSNKITHALQVSPEGQKFMEKLANQRKGITSK